MTAPTAAVDAVGGRRAKRIRAFDGTMAVSAATAASGALIYVFHVLAARTLGAESYGRLAVLWAALFVAVVMLFRPLEQTTARSLASRLSLGQQAADVVVAATRLALLIAVPLVGALVLARGAVADALFDGDETLAWALAAGVAIYAAFYLGRGVTSGMRWFAGYGVLNVGDAVARVVLALPLLFVVSESVAATAMIGAGLVGILLTVAAGRGRLRSLAEGDAAEPFPLRRAAQFAGPASVVAAADQILVNGGPILVVLGGGSAEAAGVVFAATMLVRVPVFLFAGIAASLLPNFTALHVTDQLAAVARAARRACAVSVAVGVAAGAVALAVGPVVMTTVYGEDYRAGHLALGALGLGIGGYLAAATLSQLLLALDRGRVAATAWAAGAILFAVAYVALDGGELERIAAGFVAATTGIAVVLAVVVGRLVHAR